MATDHHQFEAVN
jgi:hypothetical protein